MNSLGKTIKYGLILYVVWFLALYVLSMIFGAAEITDVVSANIIAAVLMTATAWWMGRRMKLASMLKAVKVGLWWVAISLVIVGLLLLLQQTDANIFAKWSVYPTYVGIFVGAVLSVRKSPTRLKLPPNM